MPTLRGTRLELEAQLKGDHARGAVAAQADAEQSRWRRSGVGERAESGLRGGLAGDAGEDHAGKAEIRVIEDIEELAVDAQLHALGQREPLRQVEIAPGEIGAAQRVAAEIAELAVLRGCRRQRMRRCWDRRPKRTHRD